MLESSEGMRAAVGGCSRGAGGVLYTSAIHILQYGRGVAGKGVAYRRHADVRRSANDWSIATRRFSLRESSSRVPLSPFLPFHPPQPPPALRTHTGANLRVCRSSARITPSNPATVSSPNEKPFGAYRPSSSRASRVDPLCITFFAVLKKKWRAHWVVFEIARVKGFLE